jgi:hypothetical protein
MRKVNCPPFLVIIWYCNKKQKRRYGVGQNQTDCSINFSWNKKKYTVQSDQSGKWKLKITTPEAGGPYEITISDGEAITLHNILIGEVWFCSGQSNMEMP